MVNVLVSLTVWTQPAATTAAAARTAKIIFFIREQSSAKSPARQACFILENGGSGMAWIASHRSGGDFQMRDAEDRAFGFVGQALDFPAVREDDLRDDGEAEAGAFLVCGEIGLENLRAVFGRDALAVVANFQDRFRGAGAAHLNFYLSARADGLNGVDEQIEQHLPQKLFVGLDGERIAAGLHAELLFLDVKVQRADDFAEGGGERDFGAADFARAGIVDELRELRGDLV